MPRRVRALVIDDSRVMRTIVMTSLRKTNLAEFEFVEADDGLEALEKFDPASTDIVFADWNMPRMSGIEFVRRVRERYRGADVPIVMVTSEKTMAKLEEALAQAGATDYLTKPFTVEELAHKVGKLLATVDGRRESQPARPAGFFRKLLAGRG